MPDAAQEGEDWSAQRIGQLAREMRSEMENRPLEERMAFLKGRLAGLPSMVRGALEPLVLATANTVQEQTTKRVRRELALWEKIALFAFGVVFLGLLFVLAIWFPNPTEFQSKVFCTGLALAGAGIGAILPGFVHVEGRLKGLAVRASGAVGLFVLIYWTCQK